MARHSGYRRTAIYRYLNGVLQDPSPASILIIHEFDHFDGLGGPITKEAVGTEYAKKVFPTLKSMKARTLQMIFAEGY